MNIKQIGKYVVMQDYYWKQIYSPHKRMLQITSKPSGTTLSYIDTHLMKTIKEFKRVLKWIR